MSDRSPTLHMICGKIAAGKSTLSAKLGGEIATVVISEDDWLKILFAEEMTSIGDYLRCTRKLRRIMGPHVASMLNAGVSVVLDFQANSLEARQWMRSIIDQSKASHVLHLLDVPDAVCLARLRARNARGDHPFKVTEEQFHYISSHFVAPTPSENFNIATHREEGFTTPV
jgi:predicted kinase